MVKISNGDKTLVVTMGAFITYYQGIGYQVAEEPTVDANIGGVNTPPLVEPPENEASQDPTMEGLEATSPATQNLRLSNMSVDELRALAESLGINISGTNTKKALKNIIRNSPEWRNHHD